MPDPTATSPLPRLATVREIAAETTLPEWLIYQLVREQKIPHTRIGRVVRLDREAVRQWLTKGGTGRYVQPPREPEPESPAPDVTIRPRRGRPRKRRDTDAEPRKRATA